MKDFRGIKEGHLRLFPMTVLLGANNSGKTTVLEALYLLYAPGPTCLSTYAVEKPDQTQVLTIAEVIHTYHTIWSSRGYRFLLHNYDGIAMINCHLVRGDEYRSRSIAFRGVREGVEVRGPTEVPEYPEYMPDLMKVPRSAILGDDGIVHPRKLSMSKSLLMKPHLVELALTYVKMNWGLIRSRGLTGKVANELSRLVNEDYDDLTLEPHIGGGLSLNVILRKTRRGIRLSDMGDGVRMLAIAMLLKELTSAELLLWDDVEAFMSPSSLIYLAQWMANLVEQGIQVVVATHSREAAEILMGAAEEAGQEARAVLLALRNGILKSKVLTLDDVRKYREAGVDIRMAEGYIL